MITKYPWLVLATGFLLYVDGFSQVESLRFAWLSDTHVGSTTGAEDLRAAIHDINAMNDIQFTIVSGDVTEIGSNDELLAAKTLLDSLERPYYIIPGNHDTRWSESGTTMFHRLWGDDKFTFEFGRFQFLGLHQGPRMKMGPGHWAPEDLRWLDSVLTDLPDKKRPLFIVTHYPVVPWITNWYELLERVKKFNTQAIFVGHGHTNRIDNYEGVPGVMARSTLRGVDSVGGFTIVETRADTVYFSERRTGVQSKPPWHRAILEEQTYRNDTISYPRPDFSMNLRFPRVRTRWKFTSGFTIGSTPAIWKEIAIVGDASGTVYGLALKDGDVRWRFRTGGPVYSSPDVSNGFVVFGSCDSYV